MSTKNRKTAATRYWTLPDGSFAVFVPGPGKKLVVEAVLDQPLTAWRFTVGRAGSPAWAAPLAALDPPPAGRLLLYRPSRRLVARGVRALRIDKPA